MYSWQNASAAPILLCKHWTFNFRAQCLHKRMLQLHHMHCVCPTHCRNGWVISTSIRLPQLQFCNLVSHACPNTAAMHTDCNIHLLLNISRIKIHLLLHIQSATFMYCCMIAPNKGQNSTNIHVPIGTLYGIECYWILVQGCNLNPLK